MFFILSLYFLLFLRINLKLNDFRNSILLSWIFLVLFIFLITEFWSLFNLLNSTVLTYSYIVAIIMVVFSTLMACRFNLYALFSFQIKNIELLFFPIIVLLLVIVGFTSYYFPPNNWDSMTYNLARVMHWIDNQNVEHYPTHIIRQLFNPPLAEYVIMHFYLLSKNDSYLNLVQFMSFIQCGVVVSLVVKELGYSLKAQWFSSFLIYTMPTMILQASNTKVELTLCFFISASVYFAMKYFKSKNIYDALFSSICISLSLLTKTSSFIFIVPFFVVFFINDVFKNFKYFLRFSAICIFSVILLNTPFFVRNYKTFNDPLGPEGFKKYHLNQDYSPKSFFSNLIRQASLNITGAFFFSNTDTKNVINATSNIIIKIHEKLNIDINSDKTTLRGTKFEFFPNIDEDYAGSFVHLILVIICFFILLFRYQENKKAFLFSCAAISTFLFFSFYLKWSPWHGRLQIPFFVLSCVYIGCSFDLLNKFLKILFCLILLLYAIPYLVSIDTRPLISRNESPFYTKTRDELMFAKKGNDFLNEYYAIKKLCDSSQVNLVGLILNEDSWDYPFYSILKKDNLNLKLFHVNVGEYQNNNSHLYKLVPDIIVSSESGTEKIIQFQDREYLLVKKTGTYSIYK